MNAEPASQEQPPIRGESGGHAGLAGSINHEIVPGHGPRAEESRARFDVWVIERAERPTGPTAGLPAVHRISHLPIIVDPSHGTGHNYLVGPLARAGVAVGADGLIIEVHPRPEEALCDGAQALTTLQYLELAGQLQRIHAMTVAETSAVNTVASELVS